MDGLILVDKPAGWTSHDAVAYVRRALGVKRTGHTGTLDPDATGLLLVLVGKATRLARYYAEDEKTYSVVMRLGSETDTQDASGRLTRSCAVPPLDSAEVEAALVGFSGEMMQTPPMYSAVKKDGRPLYKRARAGEEVERAPRRVFVRGIDLRMVEPPLVGFTVRCSKGLYVRTLCADIGIRLGSCAHMDSLRRTGAGGYSVEDALDISGKPGGPELEAGLIPTGGMLGRLPAAVLTGSAARALSFGKAPGPEGFAAFPEGLRPGDAVRLLDGRGALLGTAEAASADAGGDAPRAPLRLAVVLV